MNRDSSMPSAAGPGWPVSPHWPWQPAASGRSAAPVPEILSFAATPSTIVAGQSTTLAWSVAGATSLSINHGVGT